MANYGDVALGLKADWNRNNYDNQSDWMLYTVGHTDGKSDVRLKDDEDKKHQFRWVDFRDPNEVTKAQMQGFEFVLKDTWDKHEVLWAWDAEGYLVFASQRLMARPAEFFEASQKKRADIQKQAVADSEKDVDNPPDGLATDYEGKPIKKRKKGI